MMVFHRFGFFHASCPIAFHPYRLYDITLNVAAEAEATESRKSRWRIFHHNK